MKNEKKSLIPKKKSLSSKKKELRPWTTFMHIYFSIIFWGYAVFFVQTSICLKAVFKVIYIDFCVKKAAFQQKNAIKSIWGNLFQSLSSKKKELRLKKNLESKFQKKRT